MFSISLISIGLAVTLTNELNKSINNTFSEIVSDSSIVISKKEATNQIKDFYSTSKKDMEILLNDYKDYIDYYGTNYIFDFENAFLEGNDLYSVNKAFKTKLLGFSARSFNEYVYLNSYSEKKIYPSLNNELSYDEVILSITYDQMKSMCLELQIVRDFETLGNYLKNNDYFVSLELINSSRGYSDEQIFKVKGVILDSRNRIYHTSTNFNEIIFETLMRFPSSNNLNKVEEYPWVFKKLYYVHTIKHQENFLNEIFYDFKYRDYLFDSDSSLYSPLSFVTNTSTNKLFVFNVFKDMVDVQILEHIKNLGIDYKSYYFSTPSGYYNNGTNIFSGFSNQTFLSTDKDKLDKIIDTYTLIDEDDFSNIKVEEGVIKGYAFNPNSSNIRLKYCDDDFLLDEVIISKGLADGLNYKNSSESENIMHISSLIRGVYKNGNIETEFKNVAVKIKKVIEEDKSFSIYHNKNYSISLFRDLFKISTFDLIPTSIIIELNSKTDDAILNKLKTYFPDYTFLNPLIEIEKSINKSTEFLRYLLYSFSLITFISSITLGLIISLINALEEKKEIAIFKLLGFSNYEIMKVFFFENSVNSTFSFICSVTSLSFINIILSKNLSKMIGIGSINLFSLTSLLIVLLITIVISFISILSVNSIIRKIDIQSNLH